MDAEPLGPPQSTREARPDELMELVGLVRRELVSRGESLAPGWVDQAVVDLRTGDLTGWYYSTSSPGPALGFFSARPSRAYGHIHVEPGDRPSERALALAKTMAGGLPENVQRLDVGITGVPPAEEVALRQDLSRFPGGSVIPRWALDRTITPADAVEPPRPGGLRHLAVRAVPVTSIESLDQAAFRGTADETLLADSPAENLRVLTELLEGRLGPFLDAASTLLVSEEDHLVGVVLTAEESAHRGIFLDLAVAPSHQRQGIARYLVRWGERALFALGYDTVTLWVSEANRPARALYELEGFRPRLSSLIFRYRRVDAAPQPQTSR